MTPADVISSTGTTPHAGIRKSVLTAVLLSAAMAAVLVIRDTNDGPAWRVSLVLAATVAIVSWTVFGATVRRTLARDSAAASARRALVLGVLTVLSLLVFWLALSPILAIATFVLANHARPGYAEHASRQAAIAVGLAAFGLITGFVLTAVV